MPLPLDFVIVRHGESEGNYANRMMRSGDDSLYSDKFREHHTSRWRLTNRGVAQAQAAGAWIRRNVGEVFDRYYVSTYVRAMETAALLGLPHAQWYVDVTIREQDWGTLDNMTDKEREEKFPHELRFRKSMKYYWKPPAGESVADLTLRLRNILGTLGRECGDMRVIMVCHGNVIWALRMLLERLTPEQYQTSEEHIHNCQVIHYSRRDPVTKALGNRYGHVRSVCPWKKGAGAGEWKPITRRKFSNEDLLAEVGKIVPLISGE